MQFYFRKREFPARKNPPWKRKAFYLFPAVIFPLLLLYILPPQPESREPSPPPITINIENFKKRPPSFTSIERTIRKNETLYGLLLSEGLSTPEVVEVLRVMEQVYDPRRILPGSKIRLSKNGDGLRRIEYLYNGLDGVFVEREGERWKAGKFEVPRKVVLVAKEGRIESSLYEAGRKAGIAPKAIMELSDIFAWQIDFSTDIRKGDTFRLLYEVIMAEGKPIGVGKVVAAEVVNAGRPHVAIHYRGEYYDPEGKALRRVLLKSPLRYRRISSYFTKRRYHPILKKYLPHHGVDYAAPYGTPVESAGDGRIIFAGWKRGYGYYVAIKHNATYTTAYGHLSKIKRGIKRGRRVKQGEVIGYVGSTGLSTGPHLHYEVRVRGRVVNPLSIKAEPVRSLRGKALAEFKEVKEELLATLYRKTTTVAMER